MAKDLRPLCLLLLPEPLERFALREQAQVAMEADDVVAVDPPRISYDALARLPLALAQAMAGRVARRLVRTLRRNGDRPGAIVIFEPAQVLHARAMLHLVPDCELWYARTAPEDDQRPHATPQRIARDRELDEVARRLASRTFDAATGLTHLGETGHDA